MLGGRPLLRRHTAAGSLALLLLIGAASPTPSQARVLVVGDSNALGVGVRPKQTWVYRLQRQLKQSVQVFGSPGASLADPAGGIGWAAPCLFFDIGVVRPMNLAVLALGANDGAHDLEQVRNATRNTLSWVNAPWICITPLHQRGEAGALDALRAVIAAECTAVGALIIDGGTLITDANLADAQTLTPAGHAKVTRAVRDAARRILAP